jgi:hypothetical protein
MSTVENSNSGKLEGDKLYIRRARDAFPILVRQARSRQSIFYSDLAQEMKMPNARNLNYVLGAIGNSIEICAEEMKISIPPIQSLVINKSTGLPGEGFYQFLPVVDLNQLTTQQKRVAIDKLLADIFLFDRWNDVLTHLGLKEIEVNRIPKPSYADSTGESQEHIDFKEHIRNNPEIIGADTSYECETEFTFPSLDAIDLLFKKEDRWIGVEVKSRISDEPDLFRGVFQCVKYRALMDASIKIDGKDIDIQVVLAVENSFPESLYWVKNTLGVSVIDEIKK